MTDNSSSSNKNIIIDIGSGFCKAGFSNEDSPSSVFPSIIGRSLCPDLFLSSDENDYFIGLQAEGKENLLKISHPVEHGIITNWEDLEKIWNYCFFNSLNIDPKNMNIFLSEPSLNPKNQREKMATIMFEKFGCGGFYVASQSNLSLIKEGKINGLVLDFGHDSMYFTPIYNGHSFPHALSSIDFAGKFLTEYLSKLLQEIGEKFETQAEIEIARDIKENLCYLALDFWDELKKKQEIKYELPDGRIIKIGNQLFRCPEILFQPEFVGKEKEKGIGFKTLETINKCSTDIHKDLYENIILTGGSSLIKGLPERMIKEVKNNAPDDMKPFTKVIFSDDRKYSSWIGASTLSSLSSFEHMWVSKAEYEEGGAAIVSHKMMVSTIEMI